MTETLIPFPYFPGTAPSVEADYCLNRRFRQIDCTRCQEICPTQAIQLVDQLPVLDEAACVRCGACLHDCPTEVFSEKAPLEQRLVKSASALPEKAIVVVCPLHPAPEQTSTPGTVVLRHMRCLAGLGITDLIALTRDGERNVWLDDSPCAGCTLAANHAQIDQHASEAGALIAAAGRPGTVLPASAQTATAGTPPIRRPVVDGSQPKMSRRGLFASFLPAALESPAAQEPSEPEPTRWSQGKRLPPLRRKLLRRLRYWNAPVMPTLTLMRGVQVQTDRCSACELCVRFCPTDALQFVNNGTDFALFFEAARCVDCSICVLACPENAVTLGDGVTLAALTGESVPIVEGLLHACSRCGTPTSSRPSDVQPLCHICRNRSDEVRPLHDGAGLIADLFRREQSLSIAMPTTNGRTYDDRTPP